MTIIAILIRFCTYFLRISIKIRDFSLFLISYSSLLFGVFAVPDDCGWPVLCVVGLMSERFAVQSAAPHRAVT